MENKLQTVKNELPTLQELVTDIDVYQKQDKLNFLCNQPVPENWIKFHPFIKKTIEVKLDNGQIIKKKVPYPYLPIDKVNHLLRKIFKRHRTEIRREGTSFNGVYVTVRLHYWNMIYNEWDFHDGIGAIHLQVKSGSSPSDLANINNGALSMAYPLAKTLAIKDAADELGKIFGADLNRNDTLPASMDKPISTQKEKEEAIQLILDTKELEVEDTMWLERVLEEKDVLSYDKIIKKF